MDEETTQRLAALEGQLRATQAAVKALIACHTNPGLAMATAQRLLDEAAAQATPDAKAAMQQAEARILPTGREIAGVAWCALRA